MAKKHLQYWLALRRIPVRFSLKCWCDTKIFGTVLSKISLKSQFLENSAKSLLRSTSFINIGIRRCLVPFPKTPISNSNKTILLRLKTTSEQKYAQWLPVVAQSQEKHYHYQKHYHYHYHYPSITNVKTLSSFMHALQKNVLRHLQT